LIPNLTVDVAIQTASASNAPSLPREAIQRGPDGEFAWTLSPESTAVRTPIRTGVRSADHVEIRSGVDVGQLVLLPAGKSLSEGEAVQLTEAPSP
jgi:multidrug efflux system membrane fusion protein